MSPNFSPHHCGCVAAKNKLISFAVDIICIESKNFTFSVRLYKCKILKRLLVIKQQIRYMHLLLKKIKQCEFKGNKSFLSSNSKKFSTTFRLFAKICVTKKFCLRMQFFTKIYFKWWWIICNFNLNTWPRNTIILPDFNQFYFIKWNHQQAIIFIIFYLNFLINVLIQFNFPTDLK